MPDAGTMESYDGLSERAGSPTGHMEQEKRIRREIANSNERRRMQSINAGFQSLRTLLPQHEGEKLSKAAILQQTAEYIYTLEQEKTRLLSQNCQLKRIINQHEGEASSVKKRKTDNGPLTIVAAAVSESSDEGIGSMSPEPVNVGNTAPGATSTDQEAASAAAAAATEALRREIMDLRLNLDRERRMRLVLEGQVHTLENQMYPERIRELQQVQLQYHPDMETWQDEQPIEEGVYTVKTEVELPHTMIHQSVIECDGTVTTAAAPGRDNNRSLIQETEDAVAQIQGTTIVTTACSTSPMYTVETTGENLALHSEALVHGEIGASPSPCPSPVSVAVPITLVVPPPLSPSPSPRPLALAPEQRLPSALEAAIKAEPKVEVERLPSPSNAAEDSPQARLYVANTSRQNLETIVEAIRHLEGDHMFSDDPSPHRLNNSASSTNGMSVGVTALSSPAVVERLQECPEAEPQDVPLALITNSRTQCGEQQRLLKVKMDPLFQFHPVAVQRPVQQSVQQSVQQQRPGVIVEKQHT